MRMTIKGKRYSVASLEDASTVYCAKRDALNYGSSTFPSVNLYGDDGELIGHVSYNGRVWPGDRASWQPGVKPLYDNR